MRIGGCSESPRRPWRKLPNSWKNAGETRAGECGRIVSRAPIPQRAQRDTNKPGSEATANCEMPDLTQIPNGPSHYKTRLAKIRRRPRRDPPAGADRNTRSAGGTEMRICTYAVLASCVVMPFRCHVGVVSAVDCHLRNPGGTPRRDDLRSGSRIPGCWSPSPAAEARNPHPTPSQHGGIEGIVCWLGRVDRGVSMVLGVNEGTVVDAGRWESRDFEAFDG